MQQVRQWLYIGTYSDTLSADSLERCKIRAVLELATPVEHPGITTLYLPISEGVPLQETALANGIAFIRSEYAQGNRVLVACAAGVSRSTTFAIAALKEEESLSLLDAFREIASAYPSGMPHPALWQSLCDYYDEEIPFLEMWRQIRRMAGDEKKDQT